MTFSGFISGLSPAMIVCLIIGFVALLLELVTPGFGVSGMASIAFFIVAIVLQGRESFSAALMLTAIVLVLIGIVLVLVFRSASNGSISKSPIVLNDSIQKNASYISSDDMQYYISKTGIAKSSLRPSGIAEIEGVRLNVITEGEFINVGESVTVIKVDGLDLVVSLAK